jgi:hypothetical protein
LRLLVAPESVTVPPVVAMTELPASVVGPVIVTLLLVV